MSIIKVSNLSKPYKVSLNDPSQREPSKACSGRRCPRPAASKFWASSPFATGFHRFDHGTKPLHKTFMANQLEMAQLRYL